MSINRSTSRAVAVLSVGLVAALAASPAFAADASNGGFDNTVHTGTGSHEVVNPTSSPNDIAPWTVTSGSVELYGDHTQTNGWDPQAGIQSIDLDGLAPGAITQSFNTTPGDSYTVSFYYAANPTKSDSARTKTMRVDFGTATSTVMFANTAGDSSVPTAQQHTVTSLGWTQGTVSFVPTAASTALSFTSLDPSNSNIGMILDSITVTDTSATQPVLPESPVTIALALVGLAGMGGVAVVRHRRAA